MVDTAELESYLNEKSSKEGDIVIILGEGSTESKEDAQTKRRYIVLNLPVEVNGRRITYSPNKDAIGIFQKAFGMNSEAWVGKKFQIKFYPKTTFGVTKEAILPVLLASKKV